MLALAYCRRLSSVAPLQRRVLSTTASPSLPLSWSLHFFHFLADVDSNPLTLVFEQLALTATTPFQHGKIVDTDVRWSTISQAVDCRTPSERGLREPSKEEISAGFGCFGKLDKSRYDSVSSFLGGGSAYKVQILGVLLRANYYVYYFV